MAISRYVESREALIEAVVSLLKIDLVARGHLRPCEELPDVIHDRDGIRGRGLLERDEDDRLAVDSSVARRDGEVPHGCDVADPDPWIGSTRVSATLSMSAGMFSVAKVRAFLWRLIVPMGWSTADAAIAATTAAAEVEGLQPVRVQEDLELARRPAVDHNIRDPRARAREAA